MTPQELAESVKRLRDRSVLAVKHSYPDRFPIEAIQTINALVQLVGEMEPYLWHKYHCDFTNSFTKDCNCDFHELNTKSAPIAALAKGGRNEI